MDPRDIVAIIMIAICVVVFGFFGFFFPDWIGISPRKKQLKADEERMRSDSSGETDPD